MPTRLPIRLRITAWYFAVLAAGFGLFGLAAFYGMRTAILETVDENLEDQVEGVRQLVARSAGRIEVAQALRAIEEIRAGSDLLQVADASGQWIYRSRTMTHFGPAVAGEAKHSISTTQPDGVPLRLLTVAVAARNETYVVQLAYPLDDFQEALDRFRRVLLLSSPLLLLLASVGGYWLSRRALAPVDQTTWEARSISAQNLSSRLVVPQTRDELQRLSETLNGMLERLERVFRRVTQFTADASHELRTPVALMRTRAEIALRRSRSEQEYGETLRQILQDLERTSSLIENLMLLARADSGAAALERTRMDLAEALGESCREAKALADKKQIDLRTELPEAPIWVEGHASSLRRLFLILLDNAVKYTPPQGRVTVSLKISDECAIAEIHDTGIGIAAEDLPHIFERFFRADRARSRETGGTGLGLAIGRWIAEAHGGTLGAASSPGEGSVFQVRIPLAGEGGGQ